MNDLYFWIALGCVMLALVAIADVEREHGNGECLHTFWRRKP